MKKKTQLKLLLVGLITVFTIKVNAQTTALAPSNINGSSFTAHWKINPSASSYQLNLFKGDIASTTMEHSIVLNDTTHSYTFHGLDPETIYYYQIIPFDASGSNMKASNKIPVKTDAVQNNVFLISAISTVAGEKPENEFFDILFNFHFEKRWMFFGSIDIALSNVNTDSTSSVQKELTEGTANIFYKFDQYKQLRVWAAGGGIKIFNGSTYFGGHVGVFELGGSKMHSSFLTFGYLGMLKPLTEAENDMRVMNDETKLFKENLFVEFAFHNEEFPVIKHTRIKGGVLIPAPWNKGITGLDQLTARIVIEVPIGGVHKFK